MKQLALVRILTALLVWAQWMAPLRPTHHLARPEVVALSVLVWVGSGLLLFGVGSRFAAGITGLGLLALSWLGGLQGWSAGGIALSTLEGWMLGTMALSLAFTPCGGAWSVDAIPSDAPAAEVDHGGRIALRALLSAVLAGLCVSHLDFGVTAARIEQVLWARYAAVPLPGVSFVAALLVLAGEGLGALAVWSDRWRVPVLVGLAIAVLVAYPLLYLGAFPGILAVLVLAVLSPDEGRGVVQIVRGPQGLL